MLLTHATAINVAPVIQNEAATLSDSAYSRIRMRDHHPAGHCSQRDRHEAITEDRHQTINSTPGVPLFLPISSGSVR